MLTQESIQTFVTDWYLKLDVHAPMVEILPLLADSELECVFPEVTVYGYAGFESWYQRVIRTFFDEVHTVNKADATIDGDTATVDVVVHWEASVWNAPEATSKRIDADAYQTWTLKDGPNGTPILTKYVVDDFVPREGSANL